jgi:hypothetical protein
MFYLVIDGRFGTPIHVFLEIDPRSAEDYPGMGVREVSVDTPDGGGAYAVGQNPYQRDRFRVFTSEVEVTASGYVLIEPRYVGPTWESYGRVFNPQGGKVRQRERRGSRAKPAKPR